jgi:hypothetical protein
MGGSRHAFAVIHIKDPASDIGELVRRQEFSKGRKPCIHSPLGRFATKAGEKCRPTCQQPPPSRGVDARYARRRAVPHTQREQSMRPSVDVGRVPDPGDSPGVGPATTPQPGTDQMKGRHRRQMRSRAWPSGERPQQNFGERIHELRFPHLRLTCPLVRRC